MSQEIKNLLSSLWKTCTGSYVIGRKVDVAKYPALSKAIPDKWLEISEVFLENEIDEIWDSFAPYTEEYGVRPILGIYNNTVIGIGYFENNFGKIYYFDFDFGCFELENTLDEFIGKLNT